LELHGSPRSSLAAQQFFTDKKPVTTNTPPSFEDGARKSSLSLAQKMKSKRQSLERSGKGVQKQQEADDEDDYFAQNFDNTLESVEEVIEDWFDRYIESILNFELRYADMDICTCLASLIQILMLVAKKSITYRALYKTNC
jgi:hypothetical protein